MLNHPTQEAMHIRAVRSVQASESPESVARSLRINCGWLAQYRRGGTGSVRSGLLTSEAENAYTKSRCSGDREGAPSFSRPIWPTNDVDRDARSHYFVHLR